MSLVSYEIARSRESWLPWPRSMGSSGCRSERLRARVLAEPVHAVEPNPRFDNSAIDGYCVSCAADAQLGASLKVVGEVAAGGVVSALDDGEALRVFTGRAASGERLRRRVPRTMPTGG